MNSLMAEILLMRKRAAFWILLGFWSLMTVLFSYILPYYAYTSDLNFHGRGVGAVLLIVLLPQNLVANITSSFPFSAAPWCSSWEPWRWAVSLTGAP